MEQQTVVRGVNTFGLLGIILVLLRAFEVIHWSWWLVLLPFWIGPLLFIIVIIAGLSWYGIQHARGVDIDRKPI